MIPSFRIANEAIEKDIALMEKYGVEVKCGAPAPSVDELKKQGYTHILLAVGAWKPGKLDIAGDVAGAIQWMKGVKAGNIAVAGNIVVVGGGNTAMDAARLAKRSGADGVLKCEKMVLGRPMPPAAAAPWAAVSSSPSPATW